tara:strand:- start:336 stop:500 length:165 start_codon:yes stop_codon:yes gene_type:complete
MTEELPDMSDKEYKAIEELVMNVKKLNDSLTNVADSVYDLRSSLSRMWKRIDIE